MNETVAELERKVSAAEAAVEATKQIVAPSTDAIWDKQTVLTLSIAILIFGLFALFIVTYLLKTKPLSPILLPAFALPLIIISAIFLVVTGYSQEQIAPVIGLLGSIAGYLLGRIDRNSLTPQTTPEANVVQPPAPPANA